MVSKYIFRSFLVGLLFMVFQLYSNTVVRAAIDIGTGGIRLRVAQVDLDTNKIVKMLSTKQYLIIFQSCLLGSDKILSNEIMAEALGAIKSSIDLVKSFETSGIVIIGTAVFRNALNGQEFANKIYAETGLSVHILDQDLEGELAFNAVLATSSISAENLVVWDIGGGSMQLIAKTEDGSYFVDGNDEGSGSFRYYIIKEIQDRDFKICKSPNPISFEQANLAELQAINLCKNVNYFIKDKIINEAKVIGVGTVFGKGLAKLMSNKNPFTIEELSNTVEKLIGKTDSELGGGDLACIEVSNALLALGFMKGLNIKQMSIIDANNAEGAMVYERFWK